MDAISELVAREWRMPVKRFFVTGASKRGWTSWLAGAADPRVVGVVPVVFDNLNFAAQMKNQKAIWNEYSAEIGDYTARSLPMLPTRKAAGSSPRSSIRIRTGTRSRGSRSSS